MVSVGAHSTVKKLEAEKREREAQDLLGFAEDDESEGGRFEVMQEMQLEIVPESNFNLAAEFETMRELEKTNGPVKVDQTTLTRTIEFLQGEGVDLSFLLKPPPQPAQQQWVENPVLKDPTKTSAEKIQAFIDDNAKFVSELQRLQNERFSRGVVEKPSQRELDIGQCLLSKKEDVKSIFIHPLLRFLFFSPLTANRLRTRLISFVEAVPPRSLISKKALQVAMPLLQPNDPVFMGTLPTPQVPKMPQARAQPSATTSAAQTPLPIRLDSVRQSVSPSPNQRPGSSLPTRTGSAQESPLGSRHPSLPPQNVATTQPQSNMIEIQDLEMEDAMRS